MTLVAETVLQVRHSDGAVAATQGSVVTNQSVLNARPWRTFRWYHGQRHYSGSYWCATTEELVGYESRLELANLISEDFDSSVVHIVSQPFLMSGPDGRRPRRHVPDYLSALADGTVRIIDVKPASLLQDQRIAAALDWSRRVIQGWGWEYRVLSEPDETVLSNLRFLAGYRRKFQFHPADIDSAVARLDEQMPIGEAIRSVSGGIHDEHHARAIVLHLLWTHRLSTDLTQSLQATSIVEPS